MKRITLALSAVLLLAQAALAQQPPGPPRGGPPIERIAKDLGLDDTQKAEVKRILDEQRAKHEAERQQFAASTAAGGERPTREQMQTKMQQHDQELTQALSGVLTTEQLTKLKQLQEERRSHMRNGPPPGPPGE